MTSIALGLPYLPSFSPERDASLAKLKRDLALPEHLGEGIFTAPSHPQLVGYREFTDKEPNRVWARKMWKWGLETGAEFFLTLQDDVEAMPEGFWEALQAMLAHLPRGNVLGLASIHPGARELMSRGHRWFRTRAWCVGWGYGLWREDLEALVQFDAGGAAPTDTEDSFVNRFVGETGRFVWHPSVSIIDHRCDLESSYRNDDHINRRATVRWEGFDPKELGSEGFWRPQSKQPPPLIPMPQAVPIPTSIAKHRVFIATPHKGGLEPAYVSSVLRLMRQTQGIEFSHELDIIDYAPFPEDIVRARSRLLRVALQTNCTHLLMLDADNSFEPDVILGMLATKKDFVQAPYRRRDGSGGYTIKGNPAWHALGCIPPDCVESDHTVEIIGTGLGCTLLSRKCMEDMIAAYQGKDLDYIDLIDGKPFKTTAVFHQMFRDGALCSEDISFCHRYGDIGGKVWLYLGPGSPVAHHSGLTVHRGRIEDFGLCFEAA
jgi:hypothetical protein